MTRQVEAQYLRPDQIVAEREKNSLVYLPVGPLEWHGPHLLLGTDPLRAHVAAVELAGEIGGIVMPTLFVGTERERSPEMLRSIGFGGDEYVVGMDFPGNALKSLYFREEVFAVLLRNYLDLLVDDWRFERIVVVNGHGGENHIEVIRRLSREYEGTRRVRVLMIAPMLGYPEDGGAGHATREETETLMAYYPENVDLARLPPEGEPLVNTRWAIVDDQTFRGNPTEDHTVRDEEDPRLSDAEEGRRVFAETIGQLKEFLIRELDLG